MQIEKITLVFDLKNKEEKIRTISKIKAKN